MIHKNERVSSSENVIKIVFPFLTNYKAFSIIVLCWEFEFIYIYFQAKSVG